MRVTKLGFWAISIVLVVAGTVANGLGAAGSLDGVVEVRNGGPKTFIRGNLEDAQAEIRQVEAKFKVGRAKELAEARMSGEAAAIARTQYQLAQQKLPGLEARHTAGGATQRESEESKTARKALATEHPQELQKVDSKTSGKEIAGIGVVLGREGHNLVVKGILSDSVAARSGAIRVGDRLIAVAQENMAPVQVKEMNLDEAVRLIRGPKGTTVRLTMVAFGNEESQACVVSFVRGELKELSRWGDGVPLQEGTQAPNVQMLSLPDRTMEQLAHFRGKVVVLEFWATWCAPCQKLLAEMQNYPDIHPGWKDKVVLIAASVDENAEVAGKHVKAKGWSKPHNVWIGIEAIKAYHVNRLPTTYIIDQRGHVVSADYAGEIPHIVNRLLEMPLH